MKKMIPQNFNDLLCILLIFLIVLFWVLSGMDIVNLEEQVSGALIVTWTLLIQYYFRRKPPTNGT